MKGAIIVSHNMCRLFYFFVSGVLALVRSLVDGCYPADLRRVYEGLRRGAAVGGAVHRTDRRVPGAGPAQGGGGRPLDLLEGKGEDITALRS